MSECDVPVLIVGGSLVGLSAAMLLGAHGITSQVVERHPGTSIYPRAASFHQRSMEIFRSLGAEDEIAAVAAQEFVQNGGTVSVESLGGTELQWYHVGENQGVAALSPCLGLFITQIGLEPILRRRAEELGARISYDTELLSLTPYDGGVAATVRDRNSGLERTITAKYVIAADGNRSAIRTAAGIALEGRGTISNSLTLYFQADVRSLLNGRTPSVVYVFNPRLRGFFRFAINGDAGFLAINATMDEAGERSIDISGCTDHEEQLELLKLALGAPPELPITINHAQEWAAAATYAERMQEGRIFLVGDSAHAMPPTGGFGGNTGIHDAHNLAWKLALVLKGLAGEELLSTYSDERKPAAALSVEQAYSRYVRRLEPELGTEGLEPLVDATAVDMGYIYRSGAVVGSDASVLGSHEDPRHPAGTPGTRAAHLEVNGSASARSTLDLFGTGFTLLAGADGEPWRAAAKAAEGRLGIDIAAYQVGADVDVADGDFERAYGVAASGAVLVRPDGFIAWKAYELGEDPEAQLLAALSSVLATTTEALAEA